MIKNSAGYILYCCLLCFIGYIVSAFFTWTGPNTTQKRQRSPLLGTASLPKFNQFLDYLYCQKQLKMKILIKNGMIFILKSVFKEH